MKNYNENSSFTSYKLYSNLCNCILRTSKDELTIRDIMSAQRTAWNNGDLQDFMEDYWQNDSLKFIGKSGITYRSMQTLENHKKNYPDTLAMGKLAFDLIEVPLPDYN